MKRIITILLLILCTATCQTLFGQEHVYPITTGISWAQEQYEKMKNESRQVTGTPSLPPDAPQFEKAFTEFEQNYKLYHSYNDSIFLDESANSDNWINIFVRRSECYSTMYLRNNSNFDQIFQWFKRGNVPAEGYDSLYFWTRDLFHHLILDSGLQRELIDILIPYYEKIDDTEHLVFCYLCAGYSCFQYSRMGAEGAEENAIDYFQKAFDLGSKHFSEFKDPINRYYTLAAVTNLVILHLQTGTRTFEQSHELVTSFRALIARPQVQAVMQSDEQLQAFAHWALEMYETRAIVIYINRGINDAKLFKKLYAAYDNRRSEMGDLRNLKYRYYAKLEYDDLLIEATRGNISWNEAFRRFNDMLNIDMHKVDLDKLAGYMTYNLYNLFLSYCHIVERTSMSGNEKNMQIKEMLHKLIDAIEHIDHIHYPIEKGLIVSNIATSENLLKYMNEEERGEVLYHLMIADQTVTYVHVNMVKDLAAAITRNMINKNPTYFVGMEGLDNEADVRRKGDSILHLVEQGAIYHDLGKVFIPAITSNSYRRLNDLEFDLIKLHPERSMSFFNNYATISPYRDIALGHHKWYNGAGYPASFDNQHSPLFQIINIVTLADCLDAATEYFERNYRRPKSFEEVISEFEQQSGTRYDPVLVNFIIRNADLYHELERMVRLGRFQRFLELNKAKVNKAM